MPDINHKDPLHGVTLETVIQRLVDRYGWEDMARRIRINCFAIDPSVKSSLTFLRRTPWARKKVEDLYVHSCHQAAPRPSRVSGHRLPGRGKGQEEEA